MDRIHLALDRIRFDTDTGLACPECRLDLVLHQPDPHRPERILGTCDGCGAWFLVVAKAGAMARLPDDSALQEG